LNNTQAAQLAAGPVFPGTLATLPTGGSVSAASLQFMAPDIKTPYSEQGNIGIQRELTRSVALNVSYIWSRGIQLYGIRDLNFPTQTTNFTYTIADENGNTTGTYTTPVYIGTRPDTRYGAIYYDENGVNSYYNALAVHLDKRFSHGLTGKIAYTWSHEIDDGQSFGESTNNLFLNGNTYWLYNGNYRADKGTGTLDQRHRFVLSWVYQPTFTHRTGAFYRYVVNSWQLSSITTLQSGHPYDSPQIRVGDTPVPGMFSSTSINGSGLSFRVPWLSTNSYYLPAQYRADARLSKLIPFGDRYKLYLNFEVFNVANTWSATAFTSKQFYNEAKGVISATPSLLFIPSADAGFPDGTQARRMQISGRFTF
ncbi:MAG TPA: hypothetical protein VGF59_09530, partial [Bryobacteraceae bacterium]